MKHSFRQNAPDIALFDCCMGVGESGFFDRRGITEPGVLLRMMDRFGIAEALVYDQQEVEIGRFGDNAFILDFCRASPRLHPSVALTPPGTGELPPPREWVASLLAQGIRAMLPHVDEFRPVHNLSSMATLVAALSGEQTGAATDPRQWLRRRVA